VQKDFCNNIGKADMPTATANVRYWTRADKRWILARARLSAYDPTATLAMHCGNDLMRPCSLWGGSAIPMPELLIGAPD
jgi:hypothetical protein